MGGRAWLDGSPLYADGAMFHTQGRPGSAVHLSPAGRGRLRAVRVAVTARRQRRHHADHADPAGGLDGDRADPAGRLAHQPVSPASRPGLGACWLAAAIVAPAVIYLEPIRSNFDFGQINVVLMTLVIADCVPRKTPWPRGLLLGVAIALKLTPAVFLLYFLLRRDTRAVLVTAASAVVRHAGRLRVRVARLVGVLDRDGSQHRPDRHRDAEHQPEHRRRAGAAGPGRGRPVRAVDGGLLRRARASASGRCAARCAPTQTRPGAHLRGHVRPGGLPCVVVAPLGLGAAHGAGRPRCWRYRLRTSRSAWCRPSGSR